MANEINRIGTKVAMEVERKFPKINLEKVIDNQGKKLNVSFPEIERVAKASTKKPVDKNPLEAKTPRLDPKDMKRIQDLCAKVMALC